MRIAITLLISVLLGHSDIAGQETTKQNKIKPMQATIKTPTNKLENSIDFYTKLGFEELGNNLTYTDGKVIIEIDTDKFARPGFNLYKASWQQEAEALKGAHNVIKTEHGYMLTDPSGVWIYLLENENKNAEIKHDGTRGVLGNYMGLSLETGNMKSSYPLYKTLGFEQVEGSPDKGYVVMKNSIGFVVSLMNPQSCPHLFHNPSMTYFNGKNNLSIVNKIKELGIPITQEITWFNKEGIVDNIIIRDPGGYGFFIFSD
jgi:catechol 2,3-dioxygenase-like lactoylglutathione lyase family enzyme